MEAQTSDKDARRDRRGRVRRIRNGIITFIAVWIVVSIITMTFLCIKVVSLQRQVNVLLAERIQAVTPQYTSAAQDTDATLVMYDMDAEENLADPDDILKVYLTFDDGPSDRTDEVLDILDDYNIKATFFVTGHTDEHSKEMYKRIVAEGHTIAMHSYTHRYGEIYASLDAFAEDLDRIQNLIYDVTGVDCMYYRFPGGSSNKVSNTDMTEYIQYLTDQGITYFDWNVASGDATTQAYTADDLVENVMRDVVKYKTSVVLFHDSENKTITVEALPIVIEQLQAQGAVLLPISEDTRLIQHVTLSTE
ncbi:MAG: polysaccharide deacetylase [Lachnospiraceae bacterium]|nr:polysaccharide deacetylase [Lachnospiraceae bacterium]